MAKWTVPISKLVAATDHRLDLVVRKSTFEMFAAVVRRSPVDTGRFRANWNVSLNTIDTASSESTAQARAEAELRKALNFPMGGTTYLANSLPYAIRLEEGWSQQAPTGMVRITATEWRDKVASAIKNL